MKNILLIAGLQERYYFGPFVDACSGLEIRIHIFDPSLFPDEAEMHIVQDLDGSISGYIDTVLLQPEDQIEHVRLPLSEIHAAWYVRENHRPRSSTMLNDLESRFIQNESRQALRALLTTLDCTWVNSRESIERVNSNKLYQQTLAARCGLKIPRTLISNSPEEIIRFAEKEQGVLLKSMGYIRLDDEGKLALYSEHFSLTEIQESAAAIRCCPIYCQTYVQKRFEHRVMVIGSKVLSCRIDSQASDKTKVDWRHYDFKNVEHRQVELPQDLKERLTRFMQAADLRYGAIDLIEEPNGDYVFLEVNPSGQWGWIADLAGIPVAEAVANLLESI